MQVWRLVLFFSRAVRVADMDMKCVLNIYLQSVGYILFSLHVHMDVHVSLNATYHKLDVMHYKKQYKTNKQ